MITPAHGPLDGADRAPGAARGIDGGMATWVHRRLVDAVSSLGARAAVELASTAGRVAQRVHGRPRPADVESLIEQQPAWASLDPARLARDISASAYRNRILTACTRRRGIQAISGLVDPECLPGLSPLVNPSRSAVLVTWHLGPSCGITAAFDRLGVSTLAIVRSQPPAIDRRSQVARAGRSESDRTAALWRAVRHLRDGGLVVIAADGLSGERSAYLTFLGRRVRFARGPLVLARLAGAPMIPIVASWTRAGLIHVELGPELDVGADPRTGGAEFEAACASAIAAWMEPRLLAAPQELRPHTVRWLASAERA